MVKTTESEKYNGWKNFETWGVNLIITNTEPDYTFFKQVCKDAYDGPVVYDESERLRNAAEALRSELEGELEDFFSEIAGRTNGIIAEILNQITDFSQSTRIDFAEIAKGLLGE